MASSNLTMVLAIWGAVTGTVGTLIALLTHLRDRPQFRMRCYYEGLRFDLLIEVANVGPRPLLAQYVGVAVPNPRRWYRPDEWFTRGWKSISFNEIAASPHDPVTIPPGEVAEFRCSRRILAHVMPPDAETFVTFVTDYRGHMTVATLDPMLGLPKRLAGERAAIKEEKRQEEISKARAVDSEPSQAG